MRAFKNTRLTVTVLVLVSVLVGLMLPAVALADEEADNSENDNVVRIGWFDSSFCYYDSFGRRCGIDYEYSQRISAYTGWTYEYVEDTWPNLLEMLKNGEIDILSDVSYMPEREEYMYFSNIPMGSEAYYIYAADDNTVLSPDDPSSYNGMRIGVNSNSYQQELLEEWAEDNGVDIEVVPLATSESESQAMVLSGEIDGYASILLLGYYEGVVPVTRIGSSNYYYAVNINRPDLIEELDAAMAEIHDEDPYFTERLTRNRFYNSRTNTIFTPQQEEWLAGHGPIRVGYRESYLPFCGLDEETGELTGALSDFMAHAMNSQNSPNLQFDMVPYATTEDALAALSAGEVDCVFPVYLSTYDAAEQGFRLTDPAMETEMNAILRESDRQELSENTTMTFAVNAHMINVNSFIMLHYPMATMVPCDGLPACYDAVANGTADCVVVSNYRIPSEEDTLRKNGLFTVPTGESLPLSFAVRNNDLELYSIMNRIALSSETDEMDAALASYMYAGQKMTVTRFLKDNWVYVVAVLTVFFIIVSVQLVQRLKAERLASEQKILLEDAEKVAKLEQTVSSLLNNMPGIYYTKEADTGKYLACNQAFADYVHKKDPSEIIGHTAADLFDKETADYFSKDDELALSMDEPLTFYDQRNDVNGVMRNVKITKLKYKDSNGMACLLGVFVDASENMHVFRKGVETKEDYEKARSNGIIFTHIAQALAHGYKMLLYVDINTEEFIEYRTDENGGLSESRRGWHFFEECQDIAEEYVYSEDFESVSNALDRKTLEAALESGMPFKMTFRAYLEGDPKYVSLDISRMHDDDRFLIFTITDVDEQMKHYKAAQQMQEEQISYGRISALAGDYLCIYVVEPDTGKYREYTSTAGFDAFSMPEEGDNFFSEFRENSIKLVYPEDQNRVFTALSMNNVLEEVGRNGIFTLSYRLLIENDDPRYVQMKAAIVYEKDGRRLVVGVNDIDAQVRQEEEYGRRLAQARIEANIDSLTGVKNRNAYRIYEERLNAQIEIDRAPEFALVILDVNDLKKVNDTEGHKAGDQFLRDACKIICTTFKRSPVFRVGGDEFAVLAQGDDYGRLDELVEQMNAHNDDAIENGGIVIALGMSRYEHDEKVAPVYERADSLMYENKKNLKEKKRLKG